ncbi:MAG: glycosyltransferase [Bacillota bacterium]|nr:glycosyltransferase [Bacillota bacterium]MDD3298045.1 glycosyltransferase [Bacillota bacterium]MDD3850494.1 glycosyltransferase [Bacillota bacterium]MDD4707724.1 glycosyltransferase [Bacillota bacterium]
MDIVCFSSTRWDFLWQRPQQLMSRISDRHNTLYIDHFQPCTAGTLGQVNHELFLTRVKKNLHVFSPRYATRTWLLSSLDSIYRKIGMSRPVLLVYYPAIVPALKFMEYSLLCYDCVDDFSKFSWSPTLNSSLEDRLIEKSDIIFVTSQRLMKLKKKFRQNPYLIPNGADAMHFSKALDNATVCPQEIMMLDRPIIGFVGAIYEWVDLDLIKRLCRLRPHWSFVLIGPKGPGISSPAGPENLYMLGKKEYKDLPGIIKAFDACIIPFKLNDLTASANPVKLYEYLAAGKPVVSTPIPEVLKYKDVVSIAKEPAEFISTLEKSISENNPMNVQKRLRTARENSWEIRIEQMESIIEKALASRQK